MAAIVRDLIRIMIQLFRLGVPIHRGKHAAPDDGESTFRWFYCPQHTVSGAGGVGDVMPASVLIETLRRERFQQEFCAA